MILVLFFLGVIVLILSTFFVLLLSTIKIKIENLNINNFKLNKEYRIFIQLCIFNKFKFFSKEINNYNINKIISKEKIKELNKMNKNINNIAVLKEINNINLTLEMLDLNVILGFEDANILAYIVSSISGLISIVLPFFTTNNKNIKYSVIPKFGENVAKLNLESIFSIKIVHIIYVIYILVKKGSKKNERTSDRRSYVFSYE